MPKSWNRTITVWIGALILVLAAVFVSTCTTLREVGNLKKVDFRIEEASNVRLAGVHMDNVRSFDDLSTTDGMRLAAALADGRLPLSFTLHLWARNPADNNVNARLTTMDWTLLLEDQETLSGTFDREVVLSPGDPEDILIDFDLDLVRFFDDNLQGLVDLGLALSGEGPPQNVKLRVRPVIDTRLGRIPYPSPITVVSHDVGADSVRSQ